MPLKDIFKTDFDPSKIVTYIDTAYDFVASFTVADATTNYDLDAQQATSFANVSTARLLILWTDQDISIRLNLTSNPAIAVSAGDSPIELRDVVRITNVYISNASGSTANIKVLLA